MASTTAFAADLQPLYPAPDSGHTLQLSIGAELEFVDVEGKEDPTATALNDVANRSPHFKLDKVDLALRANPAPLVSLAAELQFDEDDARVDEFQLEILIPAISGKVSVGLMAPLSKISRKSEIYPLIGDAFWRQEQYQLVLSSGARAGDLSGEIALAAGSQRRLNQNNPAEDDSFPQIVFGPAKSFDGQNMEWGGLVRGAWQSESIGVHIDAFGFSGKLSESRDVTFLRALPGYDALDPMVGRTTHYWYGARLSASWGGLLTRGELIRSKDGNLRRLGWYAQASYQRTLHSDPRLPGGSLGWFARSGRLGLVDLAADPTNPLTWSRRMHAAGLSSTLSGPVSLLLEYHWLDERIHNAPDNNEFLAQVRVDLDYIWSITRSEPGA